jgi:hypothetical protein
MIPDEIGERFTTITLILNPFAFIPGIVPLLALYAIGRVLHGEPRMLAYADSGTDLRRLVTQQLRPDPQRVFRSRNFEASQTELSKHKSGDKSSRRVRRIFTQRQGASMLDPTPKTSLTWEKDRRQGCLRTGSSRRFRLTVARKEVRRKRTFSN